MTFTLPWKTLAALLCAVISPNAAEEGLLEPGLLKFGWLKMLKASSRNARLTLSRMGKMRETWPSNWNPIGPSTALWPRFPNVPGVTGFVHGLEVEVTLQKALR